MSRIWGSVMWKLCFSEGTLGESWHLLCFVCVCVCLSVWLVFLACSLFPGAWLRHIPPSPCCLTAREVQGFSS